MFLGVIAKKNLSSFMVSIKRRENCKKKKLYKPWNLKLDRSKKKKNNENWLIVGLILQDRDIFGEKKLRLNLYITCARQSEYTLHNMCCCV